MAARCKQGTTIACKYSPEFRSLVYKINPYDISCMYKRMFEMCATNTLRDLDSDDAQNTKIPVLTNIIMDDLSYTNTFGGNTICNEIYGWQVCNNTHMWQNDGLEKIRPTGCQELLSPLKTTRSHSAFAKLEYHSILDDRVKYLAPKLSSSSCRKTFSTEPVGSRSFEYRLLPPQLPYCNSNSFSHIPFSFQHHGRAHEHIDQYRELYTHRRMKMLRTKTTEYRTYPVVLTAPPVLQRPSTMTPSNMSLCKSTNTNTSSPGIRCFDVFGSITDISITSNLKPATKRSIKKKIWKSQKPQHPQSNVEAQHGGGMKMDIGGGFRRMFASEDCISVVPEVSHRLTNQNMTCPSKSIKGCRGRPTIPNKTRTTSNDASTCVVTYLKK